MTTVEGQTMFALDAYLATSHKQGNIIFSPYSISVALTMTATGADKSTLAEMKRVLYLSDNFSTDYKNLLTGIRPSKDFELLIGNRIWPKKSINYNPQFILGLKNNFNADFLALDYQNQPEPSRLIINKWAEEKTNNKIKDLIPSGLINENTDLVLTNAIYFKGLWLHKFFKSNTRKKNFFTSKTKKISTNFMNITNEYGYLKDVDAEIIEIPYKGKDLSFIVALPNETLDIASFEKTLTVKRLQTWMNPKNHRQINLFLPKFKMEIPLNLKTTLKSLGMVEAFDKKNANFTKIRPLIPGDNMYISDVIHKAFIEVNEEGTEAAAATAVMGATTGYAHMPPPPIPFVADRPFLFFIRHIPTDAILFVGRLSNP